MMRRYRTVMAAVLATALAVAASGCSGSDDTKDTSRGAPDKVTYMTAFGAVGRDAFAWVAQEKGYFKDANLEVTIQLGAGVGPNLKAVAAGQAQFAALDMVGAWISAGKGDADAGDFKTIMAIHQQNLVSIIALEGSGITSPKDLEGKTIGAATNSVNQLLFPAYAKLAGIDADKVKWQGAQPAQLTPMLVSGQVPALSTFLIGQKGIENAAKKKAVVLPYSDYLSDLYGNGIITSGKIAKDDPDLAKRFRDAMIKALKYTLDNPQEAAEILKKSQQAANIDAAVGEINLMKPYCGTGAVIGTLDKQRVVRSIATLQANNLIPKAIDPETVVDFSIAPKV